MTAVQSLEKTGGQASNPWKTYPAYKSSGVEWLGDVPEGWDVKRLKYSASINDETLPETTDPEFEFEYVDIGGVNAVDGITSTEQMVFENAPSRARRKVRHGDTIVSTVRTYLRAIAPIRNPPKNLIVSTGFAVVRPRKVEDAYLAYALCEWSFVESVVARSTGVSYPACNASEVGCIPIPLPPPSEQRAIADFLDRETGKIDRLVAKKRELIEKLKEERAALISGTVTRGLNPDAKMKPSGVEWLGDVPEGWEVRRLKYIFPRLFSGVSVNSDNFPTSDESPGILKTSCVYGNTFRPDENKRILDSEIDRVTCPVTKNSLIISRMNTPELVGSCGYVDIDYSHLYLPDRLWIARFQNHKLAHGKFSWYLVISHAICALTGSLATGTSDSMKNLTQEAFLNILVAVPPLPEQRAIADFLDRDTGKIDRLASKVEKAIARLQEYRAALITATVTGKIDVSTGLNAGVREQAKAPEPLLYPEPEPELRMVAEGGVK